MLVTNEAEESVSYPGAGFQSCDRIGGCAWHANPTQDLGEEAFFASGVDETAAGESRGVEGAETACTDNYGEHEGADGTEDNRAECHGDGRGRGYNG